MASHHHFLRLQQPSQLPFIVFDGFPRLVTVSDIDKVSTTFPIPADVAPQSRPHVGNAPQHNLVEDFDGVRQNKFGWSEVQLNLKRYT